VAVSPSYMPRKPRRRVQAPVVIIDSDDPDPDFARRLDRPCSCWACSGGVTVRTANQKYL
jgi:hypothetical protein